MRADLLSRINWQNSQKISRWFECLGIVITMYIFQFSKSYVSCISEFFLSATLLQLLPATFYTFLTELSMIPRPEHIQFTFVSPSFTCAWPLCETFALVMEHAFRKRISFRQYRHFKSGNSAVPICFQEEKSKRTRYPLFRLPTRAAV